MTEPARGAEIYLRELPEGLLPAVAGAVWREGRVTDAELSATLLALIDTDIVLYRAATRHVTGIFGAVDRATREFVLDVARWDELDPLEQELCALLFTTMAGSAIFSLEDLKLLLRSRPRTYGYGVAAWEDSVLERARAQGYVRERGHKLTEEGARLRERLETMRDHLAAFSRMDGHSPEAVEIWGPHLVMATVFGIAEGVLGAMRLEASGEFSPVALAAEGLTRG